MRASAREREYISAVSRLYDDFEHTDQPTRVVAYERAMNDLVTHQPADTEAKIFHAISLVAAAAPTDKTYANQLKAGAMLESLWAKQPNHPGLAHYIIHSYDYPALADKARAAAQRYADIAPSAAHALHMPSHTFTRVGLWQQSVATNERSLRAALATGSIAEALHASDYAMYAHLQMGKLSAAKQFSTGCRRSPRASIRMRSPVQRPDRPVCLRSPRFLPAGSSSAARGSRPRRSSRRPARFHTPRR